MKKLVKTFIVYVLILVAVCSLTACSSYTKLKKAFENEGYTESQTFEENSKKIKAEIEKDELTVECHLMMKSISLVLLCEFNSTEDLAKAFNDSATLRGFVQDVQANEDVKALHTALEDAGFVKGNCLVIPLSIINVTEVTNIVKNA